MSNEVIFFLEIVIVFSLVLTAHKLFGKLGLLTWIAIAVVIADIEVLKNVNIFGMDTTLGSVIFGSIFLATDILTECYGLKEAKRGVYLAIFCSIIFALCSQITLLYSKNIIDFADEPLRQILSINLRVLCASLLMFFIANMADVFLYERLRIITCGKKIWLRNNLSTIICNCAENFLLMILGFYGMFTFAQCIEIAITSSIIEIIVGICDTPFLYLALRKRNR